MAKIGLFTRPSILDNPFYQDFRGYSCTLAERTPYIELAPAFMGIQETQDDFLDKMIVGYDAPWTWQDTMAAHTA